MIGEYTLKLLCDKYGISSENIVNKNNNILSYGEYDDIDKTLDYLMNKLKIDKENIEKCPSILYRNVNAIKNNIDFLNQKSIFFSSIEDCLHVLSTEPNSLKDTYKYIEENYGGESINKNTSVLSCEKDLVITVEKLGLDKSWNLAIASGIGFGYTTLEEVENIVNSIEFKTYPELFTSQTLARGNLKKIQEMINSKDFKEHPELFTSETLAHSKVREIQKMINSKEFKEHPELFTSQTLAHGNVKEIQEMINSKEFKEHLELFTSQTLAHGNVKEIQKMINSDEFKKYSELFTSQTLAHGNIKEIQKMINSKEFKEHPELFTSTTLAHGNIEEIKEIIYSDEFKKYPELFTSTTLAHARKKDIKKFLQMPYWNDARYKKLLTSSIVAKAKQMITKLPVLIRMAEYYKIDGYLTTTFLILSPSQNFALINYLNDNNIPLIENDKLNNVFGKQPGVLKKKYGIDIKEQMLKYDFSKFNFDEVVKKGGMKNGIG